MYDALCEGDCDMPGKSGFSRRSFMQVSAVASAAAAFQVVTEPMLARAAGKTYPGGAVRIDSNENPLGPCAAAREAASAMVADGGRYNDDLTEDLQDTFAEMAGLKPEYVRAYPGSSSPLCYSVVAFTSPKKSYVTADPGYEAGMFTAAVSGARVVKVALTKNYAHDVKAMLAQAPDAGLFYVCTPNNPTGTMTSHSDIEYLVENKPKGSVVLVDEAYIHFSDGTTAMDLVKADKDVIVLRTFSKTYGMAGLRCGFAVAKPDLQDKIGGYGGWNAMPVTAVAAASASLKDAQLVPERKRINAVVRAQTFQWLDKNGYSYIPSESNCFMLDTKHVAKDVIASMKKQNVFVGRVWPVMPTWVRITVGTQPEMERFQAAFQRVMNGTAVGWSFPAPRTRRRHLDGFVLPA
jgi:histidinol-phosphate aminotransferase